MFCNISVSLGGEGEHTELAGSCEELPHLRCEFLFFSLAVMAF